MNIGRLITTDGIEFTLDSSQLTDLAEYLRRQELNDTLAKEAGLQAPEFVDPEEYERIAQAAHFAWQRIAAPATL